MRRKLNTVLRLTAATVAWSPPLWAQDAPASPEIDTITLLPHLIRWEGMIASLLIIAGAWLLLRFVKNLVDRLGEVFAERRLLLQRMSAFFRFVVYFVTIITTLLLSFEFSRELLTLLGGATAVAFGFAVKDLVASLVAGIMIMFDRPFQLGDRVNFAGHYGDITAIGLRSVKLQTLDDSTVTIPNNMLLSEIVSSGNSGELDMQIIVNFHIGIDQDVHKARKLAHEAAITSRYIHLPKPVKVLVSQVIVENYVAIRLSLKAYVFDTKFEKDFETDVTLRVLESFDESDIKPPAILHRNYNELQAADHRALRLADQASWAANNRT